LIQTEFTIHNESKIQLRQAHNCLLSKIFLITFAYSFTQIGGYMIYLIACNKGGAGKTTTATNLAVGLAKRGKSICLVDADKQRSASKWYQYRIEEGHQPTFLVIEKLDNISAALTDLNEKYDFVIVDVAGRNSRELITGATVADVVIAPHQASQLDLDTLNELQEQVIHIRDLNPRLQVYVFHAMANTNPAVKEAEREAFLGYASDFKEFQLLNSINYYRKIYRDVISEGKSVLEADNDQAITEANSLLDEILEVSGR